MKKFAIFTLVLALGAMMLAGCGCMNTKPEVPTLPTNGETTSPTLATQAPTTEAATMPTTMATTAPSESGTDTTGTLEGAMDDITGTENTTDAAVPGRSGSRMMPRK